MKLTKAEKIWIAVVVIFYILYNLPFFPKYYMPKATIVHAIVTIIPLWVAIYVGFFKICRGKRKNKTSSTDLGMKKADAVDTNGNKEDVTC